MGRTFFAISGYEANFQIFFSISRNKANFVIFRAVVVDEFPSSRSRRIGRDKNFQVFLSASINDENFVILFSASVNDTDPSVKLLGDFVAGITCEEYDGGEGEQGKEDLRKD